jgi:hypothetical protein
MKQAVMTTPPNLNAVPRVDFMEDSFQSLIYSHGYNITIEPTFPCPCNRRVQGVQSQCLNCQGTGWVWGTPLQCKAVIQSINKSTRYKEWSKELTGKANITIEHRFRLSEGDKVTMIDSDTISAENLLIKEMTSDGKLFAATTFPVRTIQFLFRYVSATEPLQRLVQNQDFIFENNKIVFLCDVKKGDSVSVRYNHNVQFLVEDVNHDIRNAYVLDDNGREKQNMLPVSAVIQRLYCQMDGQNFAQNNVLYNPTT